MINKGFTLHRGFVITCRGCAADGIDEISVALQQSVNTGIRYIVITCKMCGNKVKWERSTIKVK